MKQKIRRYSEAFRRQVVAEYEAGESINQLGKKYGITGGETIQKWIRKYGKEGFRHEIVRIQTAPEAKRVKELEAQVQELEQALAKMTLEKLRLESTLEVIEEEYEIDVKKNAVASLSGSTRKPKSITE